MPSKRLRQQETEVLHLLRTRADTLLTTQIALLLSMDRRTTQRALRRLAKTGSVIGVQMQTAEPWPDGKPGKRTVRWWEWRAATNLEERHLEIDRAVDRLLKQVGPLTTGEIGRIESALRR